MDDTISLVSLDGYIVDATHHPRLVQGNTKYEEKCPDHRWTRNSVCLARAIVSSGPHKLGESEL